MAARARADLIAVHVRSQDGLDAGSDSGLGQQRALIEQLGGVYREFVGEDIGEALVAAARSLNATQIVLGATRRSRWRELTRGSVINRVIRETGVGIDVHVISVPTAEDDRVDARRATTHAAERASGPAPAAGPRRRCSCCSRLLGVALTHLRETFGLPSVLLSSCSPS